ncbi:MAG TPA: TatD family hydrolase [Cyclobacteriaceae bacterium]|nr:TatD family hydrolase [Cyclobacteriaceae bacterium]HMV08555.1 TatD family hydrolase [Cyclobacteriaceae bacterium]HMV90110.1 TatD family hydrolase [Cyclobacteriaceae bacterium]HMX00236.1 TatD family hydrolase [Cyclobacteriaceae bacterium]HMX49765.1 TatD family hydrolase [Cyclobacteriaceae bacterium]
MSEYWIDTHAHIFAKEFDADRDDMMQRAQDVEIGKIFMPNIDHTTIDSMLELERKYPAVCYPMMGLHPCHVKKDFEKELYIVESWLNKRKFSAVGEMGTDLYWDKTFWDQQVEAFTIQVGFAKKHNVPIVVHCRESIDQTLELVEKLQDGKLKGVFHCFTGSKEQAEKLVKLGFYAGIGGVATFKKGGMENVLPHVPLDRIVLETDSPYLAPTPHRGKRNEPAYIPLIAQRVAELKNTNLADVQNATTQNALTLFKA